MAVYLRLFVLRAYCNHINQLKLYFCCATDRVFGILREKNPELTGERRRTVLKPPQVGVRGYHVCDSSCSVHPHSTHMLSIGHVAWASMGPEILAGSDCAGLITGANTFTGKRCSSCASCASYATWTHGAHTNAAHARQVAREGTKKTVFTNFMDLCKAMNRQHEHVSMYLLAEL